MRALLAATAGIGLCLGLAAGPAAAGGQAASPARFLEPSASPGVLPPDQQPLDARSAAAKALEPGRTAVERAWFAPGTGSGERANRARIEGLRAGIDSLDDAARALLRAPDGEATLEAGLLAARIAPDLPLAQAALAGAHWRDGDTSKALDAWQQAVFAAFRHPEALLWLVGTALGLAAWTLAGGALLAVALLAWACLPAACHDAGDALSRQLPGFARGALVASALLAPLALGEGLVGLALVSFFVAFAYGGARHRVALAAAAALLVLALFPVAWYAGKVLLAPDADPVAEASMRAFRGSSTRAELELLLAAADDDVLAASALAARARQRGRREEARFRYRELLERRPTDPVALTNAANWLFEEGRTPAAIELYERAALQLDSAKLLFDLSQAYGRTFRMEELERALSAAQEVDPETLNELSLAGDANLVVDLEPAAGPLRRRVLEASDGGAWARALRARLAPGWLGVRWWHAALAFGAAAAAAMALGRGVARSGRCSRCGARQCPRCDGASVRRDACESCRRLFLDPGGTDPSMRMARLTALRSRQRRRDRLATALGLVLPGAAGLAARRPDLAVAGALVGVGALAAFAGRHGLVPDPLVLGEVGPLLWLGVALLAALAHVALWTAALAIRRRA